MLSLSPGSVFIRACISTLYSIYNSQQQQRQQWKWTTLCFSIYLCRMLGLLSDINKISKGTHWRIALLELFWKSIVIFVKCLWINCFWLLSYLFSCIENRKDRWIAWTWLDYDNLYENRNQYSETWKSNKIKTTKYNKTRLHHELFFEKKNDVFLSEDV